MDEPYSQKEVTQTDEERLQCWVTLNQTVNENVRISAADCKGKHIIMLIGPTGAGKSTTIAFLSQAKISKKVVEVNGKKLSVLVHDLPQNKLVIGHSQKSQTRFLELVEVPCPKLLGERYYCDPPGFGDSSGVFVDVENFLSIMACIRSAASIVPVLVFSPAIIEGAKGSVYVELLTLMAALLPHSKIWEESLILFMTNVPKTDPEKLRNFVSKMELVLERKDLADPLARELAAFIAKNFEKSLPADDDENEDDDNNGKDNKEKGDIEQSCARFVNPANYSIKIQGKILTIEADNVTDYFYLFKKAVPISPPDKYFVFKLPPKVDTMLRSFLGFSLADAEKWFEEKQFGKIQQFLKVLADLKNKLPAQIEPVLQKLLSLLSKEVNSRLENVRRFLSDMFQHLTESKMTLDQFYGFRIFCEQIYSVGCTYDPTLPNPKNLDGEFFNAVQETYRSAMEKCGFEGNLNWPLIQKYLDFLRFIESPASYVLSVTDFITTFSLPEDDKSSLTDALQKFLFPPISMLERVAASLRSYFLVCWFGTLVDFLHRNGLKEFDQCAVIAAIKKGFIGARLSLIQLNLGVDGDGDRNTIQTMFFSDSHSVTEIGNVFPKKESRQTAIAELLALRKEMDEIKEDSVFTWKPFWSFKYPVLRQKVTECILHRCLTLNASNIYELERVKATAHLLTQATQCIDTHFHAVGNARSYSALLKDFSSKLNEQLNEIVVGFRKVKELSLQHLRTAGNEILKEENLPFCNENNLKVFSLLESFSSDSAILDVVDEEELLKLLKECRGAIEEFCLSLIDYCECKLKENDFRALEVPLAVVRKLRQRYLSGFANSQIPGRMEECEKRAEVTAEGLVKMLEGSLAQVDDKVDFGEIANTIKCLQGGVWMDVLFKSHVKLNLQRGYRILLEFFEELQFQAERLKRTRSFQELAQIVKTLKKAKSLKCLDVDEFQISAPLQTLEVGIQTAVRDYLDQRKGQCEVEWAVPTDNGNQIWNSQARFRLRDLVQEYINMKDMRTKSDVAFISTEAEWDNVIEIIKDRMETLEKEFGNAVLLSHNFELVCKIMDEVKSCEKVKGIDLNASFDQIFNYDVLHQTLDDRFNHISERCSALFHSDDYDAAAELAKEVEELQKMQRLRFHLPRITEELRKHRANISIKKKNLALELKKLLVDQEWVALANYLKNNESAERGAVIEEIRQRILMMSGEIEMALQILSTQKNIEIVKFVSDLQKLFVQYQNMERYFSEINEIHTFVVEEKRTVQGNLCRFLSNSLRRLCQAYEVLNFGEIQKYEAEQQQISPWLSVYLPVDKGNEFNVLEAKWKESQRILDVESNMFIEQYVRPLFCLQPPNLVAKITPTPLVRPTALSPEKDGAPKPPEKPIPPPRPDRLFGRHVNSVVSGAESHALETLETQLRGIEYLKISSLWNKLERGIKLDEIGQKVTLLKEAFLRKAKEFFVEILKLVKKEGATLPDAARQFLRTVDDLFDASGLDSEILAMYKTQKVLWKIEAEIMNKETQVEMQIEELLSQQRYGEVLPLLQPQNPSSQLHIAKVKAFINKHLTALCSIQCEDIPPHPSFDQIVNLLRNNVLAGSGWERPLIERIQRYLASLLALFRKVCEDHEEDISKDQIELWGQFVLVSLPDAFLKEKAAFRADIVPTAQRYHDLFKRHLDNENYEAIQDVYTDICIFPLLNLIERCRFNDCDVITAERARSLLEERQQQLTLQQQTAMGKKEYAKISVLLSQCGILNKIIQSAPDPSPQKSKRRRMSSSPHTVDPLVGMRVHFENQIIEAKKHWNLRDRPDVGWTKSLDEWRMTKMEELRQVTVELEKAEVLLEKCGLSAAYRDFSNDIRNLIEEEKNAVLSLSTPNESCMDRIKNIRLIGCDLPTFEACAKAAVEKCIAHLERLDKDWTFKIGERLRQENTPLANLILSDNPTFSSLLVEMWNKKLSTMPVSDALAKFRKVLFQPPASWWEKFKKVPQLMSTGGWGEWTKIMPDQKGGFPGDPFSDEEKNDLKTMYDTFDMEYQGYWKNFRANPASLSFEAEKVVRTMRIDGNMSALPKLLAILFAYWTLVRSDMSMADRGDTFIRKPHCVQVISILRFFRIQGGKVVNSMIQIGTGEGKSITLGMTALVFALLGFECHCACYSRILSDRDYKDFKDIFLTFRVADRILYGTIDSICDYVLNEEIPIRDLVSGFLTGEKKPFKMVTKRPRVLLLDEVDVFFGESFFGRLYQPIAILQNDSTFEILKFIYFNHTNRDFTIQKVFELHAFKTLLKEFPLFEKIFRVQIRQMLSDVKSFKSTPTPPQLTQGPDGSKVGYELHGEISTNIYYGHKTNFAYFNFMEQGPLNEETVKKNVGMLITGGQYSYTEIPRWYDVICGATGTLQSVTDAQLDLLASYSIYQLSFAPSVHGDKSTVFLPNRPDFLVMFDLASYHHEIVTKVQEHIHKRKEDGKDCEGSALVFFESMASLQTFMDSEAWKNTHLKCEILSETTQHKENTINRSTTAGQITFVTKAFGRGTDFRCFDDKVKNAGGVLVVQTFLSESESEEQQMKGRTGRQTDPGRYVLLLHCADLMKMFSKEESYFRQMVTGNEPLKIFEKMQSDRNALYGTHVQAMFNNIKDAQAKHAKTGDFMVKLKNYMKPNGVGNVDALKDEFVKLSIEVNPPVDSGPKPFHVFFCLDESGSMGGSSWNHLTEAVVQFTADRKSQMDQIGAVCEDKFTVICYSSDANLRQAGVGVASDFRAILGPLRSGGTCFRAGLLLVYQEMKKFFANAANDEYIPVLLFMSDGGASDGDKEMADIYREFKDRSLQVYVVGFGKDCAKARLEHLALQANGKYSFGSTGESLKTEFQQISANLDHPLTA